MKPLAHSCAAAVLLCVGTVLHAQQIDWGSEIFSDLVDSEGEVLDNTFVFQLGAFDAGYNPADYEPGDWLNHWQVFDEAAYNGIEEPVDDGVWGYYTSTANMEPDGTSDSPEESSGATSFEGRQAYIWIRNGDNPEPGTEWFVVTTSSWVYPTADSGCCGSSLPLEWSSSDLTSGDTPLWGSQGGIEGPGVYSVTGIYTQQTFTFVPEPSIAMLVGLGGMLWAVRRKRAA
ncbi:PEP-CTERM sorting domain-containing protein [Haloferula sp. A504]|uniref:PEP-CTERM sorting domain-containing protein n=1 Tax=Haloferula sp. A504 TaxID=3373601 RepID=UPI0031C1A88A|nr:PEP-CTERM sorting domain-containing protein [Verrucomicrobiaceae bacterium E54]